MILSVMAIMLLQSVEARFRRKRSSSTMYKYNRFFELVRRRLVSRSEMDMLNYFEQYLYKNLCKTEDDIKSKEVNFKLTEDIDSIVNAYNFNKNLGTFSYGTKSNNNFIKIMISGAKGQAMTKDSDGISTLALSEIVERDSMAVSIAYASRISATDYVLDAKVDQKKIKMTTNNDGQVIISSSVGNKYMLKQYKTVIAVTKMYRLIIGVDYIKFEVNLLVAGASCKNDEVISKSIIKINTYLIAGESAKARQNLGLFTSENRTNAKKSLSTHFGLLKVNKKNYLDLKTSEGIAKANKKGTKVDAVYNQFKRLTEQARNSKA